MSLHLEPYEYGNHVKHHDEPDDRCVLCIYEPHEVGIALSILANLENTLADLEAFFGEQPELQTIAKNLYKQAEEL